MQGAEEENQAKSRSDEDSINFRPSPNFKHMKKYLKSKFEEANQIMTDLSSSQGGSNSSSLGRNKREEVNTSAVNASVQPPLPPNPPPPDSPPVIITNLKKEIEDDEYPCSTNETPSDYNQPDELKTVTIKTDQSEPSDKPKVTMCRNFARGTCKKGASCIFTHELILSQLPGVYTFCRNFQNSVCTFPKCKFVHATVFEKECFFRTGYLPPHTLAHLKEGVLQPPPPPPQPKETPAELPQVYPTAPPPPTIPCIPPVVVAYNPADTGVDRSDPNIFRATQTVTATTSPKREWSESDEVSSSTRDLNSGETLAKKCKNCDSNEFRYHFASLSCSCSEHGVKEQLIKTKVEKFARANKELDQKISQLNKRNAKLAAVIGALFKPSKTSSGANGLNIVADTENSLLSNNNFTALLAKMLLNAESVVPPDGS